MGLKQPKRRSTKCQQDLNSSIMSTSLIYVKVGGETQSWALFRVLNKNVKNIILLSRYGTVHTQLCKKKQGGWTPTDRETKREKSHTKTWKKIVVRKPVKICFVKVAHFRM